MTETNLEREYKFDVDPDFVPPDLGPLVGRTERLPGQLLTSTYYDTRDYRLWSLGVTLRYRDEGPGGSTQAGEWTLKLPEVVVGGEGAQGPVTRSELSWPGEGDEIPAAALAVLAGVARRAPLEPVVTLAADRRRLLLSGGAGVWAEMDDDLVTVTAGRRTGLRFRQVELELLGPPGPAVTEVVELLRRAGAGPPTGTPKFALAAGLDEADALPDPGWTHGGGKGADLPSAVRRILRSDLDRLLTADLRLRLAAGEGDWVAGSGDRSGPAAGVVHEAHLATRRLRSHLVSLSPLLDPVWVRHVRADLEWLGAILGRLRDEDVVVGRIVAHDQPEDADEVRELVRLVLSDRHLGAAELREALASARYLGTVDRLHAASQAPPLRAGQDGHPQRARRALTPLVAARLEDLRRSFGRLGDAPDHEALHGLRVRARHLREAAEAVEPYAGKKARRTEKAAHDLQVRLGHLDDAYNASRTLRDVTSHPSLTPAVAFVAGRLAAEVEVDMARLSRTWPRAWRALEREKVVGWLTEIGG